VCHWKLLDVLSVAHAQQVADPWSSHYVSKGILPQQWIRHFDVCRV